MKVQAHATYERVRFDAPADIHLVVSLTAPATSWEEKRAPLAILLSIDISGSMAGANLDFAKKSALKILDHVKDTDYVGIVTFETNVKLLCQPQRATPEVKRNLRGAILGLQARGGTCLSGGMMMGLKALQDLDLPLEYITRVVLLTDGHPNEGLATTPDQILTMLEKQAGRITLSAFGYGEGANQTLLEGMAQKGKGNYAYIENPDDALSAFAKELGGLLSTYAQDLIIDISPKGGHQITSVVSEVESDTSDPLGEVTLKVPNMLAEETRHLVLGVTLSKQKQALPRSVNFADISVRYQTLSESGTVEIKTVETKAKIRFVKEGEEQDKPTPEIDRLTALAQMVQAQKEAEAKAKAGQYQAAQQVMNNYVSSSRRRGLHDLSKVSEGLVGKMADAVTYQTSQGYLRSVFNGITRSVGVSSLSGDAAGDLGTIGCIALNDAQSSLTRSFTDTSAAADLSLAQNLVEQSTLTSGPVVSHSVIIGTPMAVTTSLGGDAPTMWFSPATYPSSLGVVPPPVVKQEPLDEGLDPEKAKRAKRRSRHTVK